MDNDENISNLKNDLDSLDNTKEGRFAKSKENRAKMKELKDELMNLKKDRNAVTDHVKTIKIERDKLNTELREKIAEFKKIAPPKKAPKPEYTGRRNKKPITAGG